MKTELLYTAARSLPSRALALSPPIDTDCRFSPEQCGDAHPDRALCPLESGEACQCQHYHRLHIAYSSDAIYERSQANIQRLLLLAAAATASPSPLGSSESGESSNVAFARKALRYRKIYDRMHGVDVTDPRFDASHFLGITWHKLMP